VCNILLPLSVYSNLYYFNCNYVVWVTNDGGNWTKLTHHAPWGARSWSAGVVWHQEGNSSVDISVYGQENDLPPKIWLTGGVYYGTKYKAFAEVSTSVNTH
jgi:hypothetical protein